MYNPYSEKVSLVTLDYDNIEYENIVCGVTKKESIIDKKRWLIERFSEGLKFITLKINGRPWGLIEYIPAENGWRPIEAPGYTLINCFRVLGRYKGKGYGNLLFNKCLEDAKKTKGIVILTSKGTMTPQKDFFLYKGFSLCDSAPSFQKTPQFELYVKQFKKAPLPKFRENAKRGIIKNDKGFTFFYSVQCPYVFFHMNRMIELVKHYHFPVKVIKITSKEQAQSSPSPFDTFSIFFNGKFYMHGMHLPELGRFLEKIR